LKSSETRDGTRLANAFMDGLRSNASIDGLNCKITPSFLRDLGPRKRMIYYVKWSMNTVLRTGVLSLQHYLAVSASNAAKDGTIILILIFEKKSGLKKKIEPYSKCMPNSVIDGAKSPRLSQVALTTLSRTASIQSSRSMSQRVVTH